MEDLIEMGLGGLVVCATISLPYHWFFHDNRAQDLEKAKEALSQIEEKPFNHWFCLNCHLENKEAKTFETTELKPDITRVTVKPVSCSDKVQQVVLETPHGKVLRFLPASHNEVKIETPTGKETFDLRPPVFKGVENKVSQNGWYQIEGPMSALRELYKGNSRG